MCAQFYTYPLLDHLSGFYGARTDSSLEKIQWGTKVVPHSFAPVIVNSPQGLVIKAMKFSMVPSWSKDSKVKFATYNARLETVPEKPMWKKPFLTNRCVVPIGDFIEPIYTGEFAGNMVDFFELEKKPLMAAGLYDTWVNKQTGEVLESFAIITGDPLPFVEKTGHDRSPFFITPESVKTWLSPEKKSPEELMDLLKKSREIPQLQAKPERPMKPGWEKRI